VSKRYFRDHILPHPMHFGSWSLPSTYLSTHLLHASYLHSSQVYLGDLVEYGSTHTVHKEAVFMLIDISLKMVFIKNFF
jgi:hypothetical protein